MIIGGQNVEQVVIMTESEREVIAILSDDGEWIVKNGYSVELTSAEDALDVKAVGRAGTEMAAIIAQRQFLRAASPLTDGHILE